MENAYQVCIERAGWHCQVFKTYSEEGYRLYLQQQGKQVEDLYQDIYEHQPQFIAFMIFICIFIFLFALWAYKQMYPSDGEFIHKQN